MNVEDRVNQSGCKCDTCGGEVLTYPTKGKVTCQKCCEDHDFQYDDGYWFCLHCDGEEGYGDIPHHDYSE